MIIKALADKVLKVAEEAVDNRSLAKKGRVSIWRCCKIHLREAFIFLEESLSLGSKVSDSWKSFHADRVKNLSYSGKQHFTHVMTDPNEQHLSGDPSLLYTTILITGAIASAFFIFSVVMRKLLPRYYLRKCYVNNYGGDLQHPNYGYSSSWLRWIPYVVFYNEEGRILNNYTGLDQVLYLKFLKYSTVLFAALTMMNTPLLMGLYSIGQKVGGLDAVTMSNLAKDDKLMWAPLVMTVVTVFAVWIFIYQLAKKAATLTIIDSKKSRDSRTTVVIREVPQSLRSESGLHQCLTGIYNEGEVIKVHAMPNAAQVRTMQDECLNKRNRLRTALEYNRDKKEKEPNMMMRSRICGPKVDAVEYLSNDIATSCGEIDQLRFAASLEGSDKTPLAFAVFRRSITAVLASQTVHRHPWNMTVSIAPDVRSIIWKNVSRSLRLRFIGTILSLCMVVALFLFWPIPVVALSGIMNLDTLSKIPGMEFIIQLLKLSPWLTGIVQGILPTLALKIFMFLLSRILRAMHSLEFPISETTLDRALLKSYWAFMLFNVFFVCVISGALFKSVAPLLDDPMSAPRLIAAAFPGVTTFFINYILVNIAGHFQFLSRAIDLIISGIKRLFAKTKTDRHRCDVPGPFNYVTKFSDEILVFSIALTYTTLGPLANIFATVFFASAYFTTKHHFMFCYTPGYEGAKLLPIAFNMIFAALMVFQILMMMLFLLSSFPAGIAVIITLVLTVGFYVYVRARFINLMAYPPIDYLPTAPLNYEESIRATEVFRDPGMYDPKSYGRDVEYISSDAVPLGEDNGLLDFKDVETATPMPRSV
ncbi:hypothetical protein PROFUN_10190 [Planoprotostelium fungivorum]|uniref:Uncharacterized protein n=1 Tax=Planoprotostelium fungivorum TaxID=1890364 RepID=A0A2P6MQ47_9EUKA|nr:hypothetical protein PROFUN_10190 [Planoprotostelium fungivorum]